MSALAYLHGKVIPWAYSLLPAAMNSTPATAQMLAIFLQESRCNHRRQVGPGPARGFAQFEVIGVKEVLRHPASREIALSLLERMSYRPDASVVQQALEDNDVLMVCFTRLALWRHPAPLPLQGEEAKSWEYYLRIWAPGKPHPETWPQFYLQAWTTAKGT